MTTMDYAPKQTVPGTQYRVVRMIGAGGHGSVYAVEHTFLEAPAVMKVLHGELVGEGSLATRMMREARTLAKLRHPNIVEVRDGGLTSETPPRPFFVMEPLKGMPLREMIRQVPHGLGMLPSLQIAIGILNGLHYAHSAGVVHRDIKPDNIFLHKSTTDVTLPKILDFGIAHLFLGKHLTGRNFLGTPRYAAPEQIRGEPPTASTDIYATGLVLYEMLTGDAPYSHLRELAEICAAHCDLALPPVSQRLRGAPKALDQFIAMMLAKNPQDRPPTAFAAAVGLRELRSIIEKSQSKSIHSPDFKTEPTPMENALVEFGPDGHAVVAESIRRPMVESGVADTIVQTPSFDTIQSEQGAFNPTEPATPPKPQAIDRNAPTRSSPRDKPLARRIANYDTHVTDIQPESGPPSPRAPVSSQRGTDPTPSAVAMPPSSSMTPAGVPQGASKMLPVVIAAGATILVLSAISIPIALRLARAPVAATPPPAASVQPAPPPPAPAPPPTVVETASAAAVVETATPPPSAHPKPARAPAASAQTVTPATATAAPKPPPPKRPAPKPGDPSAIGLD